ncbi:hypothetical protein HWV62_35121 [Athelia sp. TMB]|nr:hypothetical protein HWV62_35121 [Athelia sp. TMB]
MVSLTTQTPVDDSSQGRPRKRLRPDPNLASEPLKISKEPRLFAPFRALGLITNHVPFILQTRSHKGATDGPRINLLTCLGRAWAMWEGGKMGLLFVGPDAADMISSMAMEGDAVWAAAGPNVIKYLRGKEVARLKNPFGSTLSSILIFGSQLIGLTEDGGRMLVWDTTEQDFDPGFTAALILHPATYLNKVLVTSSEGDMQLWNIRTQTCIHKFPSSRLLSAATPNTSKAITALTQSPAIDVVGVGFISGEISVYDVRADERLMRMFMDGGGVRALGFRSAPDGHPILASASSAGHIALWDLNSGGRLLHMIRGAHDGAISAVEWVPGQPVLISSGEDNSVKQWLFDSPTAAPRLLKFRTGHQAPPHLIRYYGEDGKQLLTASRDRSLRKASTLSIPLASLKFPPVTGLSFSSARTKDWDDVVTAHTDETFARTWTVLGKKLGKHSLGFVDGPKKKGPAGSLKAVCVTACGNFGIGGSSTGEIQLWNMQSGIKRKSFTLGPCPSELRASSSMKKNGQRSVTGIASDALNRLVIASTLDGTINRDSGLLAVVCDDMVVRVVDIETRRIVRELGGSRGRILDIVSFQTVSYDDVIDVSLPSMQGDAEDEALEALAALTVEDTPPDVFSTPAQLDGELVTLTLLPRSRWQTLLNLEVIQQRNKPKEPPKAPEKAPFFLPTLPGVETRFAIEQKSEGKAETSTRRLDKLAAQSHSVFVKNLENEDADSNYESFFNFTKTLSPAALDLELRSLTTLNHLRLFLRALTSRLKSHRDFEAVQTLQHVFLRMHADVIVTNEEVQTDLRSLADVQRQESEKVLELIASSLGTLGFVRDTL